MIQIISDYISRLQPLFFCVRSAQAFAQSSRQPVAVADNDPRSGARPETRVRLPAGRDEFNECLRSFPCCLGSRDVVADEGALVSGARNRLHCCGCARWPIGTPANVHRPSFLSGYCCRLVLFQEGGLFLTALLDSCTHLCAAGRRMPLPRPPLKRQCASSFFYICAAAFWLPLCAGTLVHAHVPSHRGCRQSCSNHPCPASRAASAHIQNLHQMNSLA